MNKPTPQSVTEYAIKQILEAMIKLDNESHCSAENHLANAVVCLNQIANISKLEDPEEDPEEDFQLEWCRSLFYKNRK